MKYLLSLIIILCRCLPAYTQDEVKYSQKDSIVATELLKSCMTECKTKDNCLMYLQESSNPSLMWQERWRAESASDWL